MLSRHPVRERAVAVGKGGVQDREHGGVAVVDLIETQHAALGEGWKRMPGTKRPFASMYSAIKFADVQALLWFQKRGCMTRRKKRTRSAPATVSTPPPTTQTPPSGLPETWESRRHRLTQLFLEENAHPPDEQELWNLAVLESPTV